MVPSCQKAFRCRLAGLTQPVPPAVRGLESTVHHQTGDRSGSLGFPGPVNIPVLPNPSSDPYPLVLGLCDRVFISRDPDGKATDLTGPYQWVGEINHLDCL